MSSQRISSFVANGDVALRSAVQGFVALHPSLLLNVEQKVIYRNDPDRLGRVAVLSGGGAGHEPAHAGFVGNQMLDAAVCGAVFASPNAKQIEAGLRAIRSPRGILIVVKNYTGDKLNFTLASERFNISTGVPVKLVIVADDVSIGRSKSALVGRRGLAGTVLVSKISGAASASGLDLDAVATAANFVIANMGTIGVGLDGCDLPGQPHQSRVADDELELGIGIHNEPGSKRIQPRPSLTDLVKEMLANILGEDPERNYLESPPRPEHHDVVLLINNLGSLSNLEIVAITGEVVSRLHTDYDLKPTRVYAGTLLSALNGPGFSITLLSLPKDNSLSAKVLEWLDAPTDAIGWPCAITSTAWAGQAPVSTNAELAEQEQVVSLNIPAVPC
ncbi:hypothetical protein G7Z17_g7867 [Cylindrodendrum hubeiense]|uniref:DhaK domain-containing protein n=1 Tax=Cylindrodendrum hubeiense TaxID=595255 RepID=A0A9P5H4V0_9HYPO|nr:hypothetical protein G7Z17_g7867 [Cylindrodendrum hubeiense]